MVGLLSLLTYFLPTIVQFFLPVQNLKKKYSANWALVTGASSGIGKEIAIKCAGQGLNVILVALDDNLLGETYNDLRCRYPKRQFKKIGVNLGHEGWIESIDTGDIDVDNANLIFCNAGYIVPGIFDHKPAVQQLCNFKCNAQSSVELTHYFLKKMKSRALVNGKRGLIAFTSSSAGIINIQKHI